MRIKSILWVVPFISFMGGYFLIQSYFGNNKTTVPLLLGKPLNQAVCILSEHMLVPRIVAEKEDRTLPVATVIHQKPDPQTSIRCNQTVLLTVSKLPDPVLVPCVVGKKIADMMPQLSALGIQVQVYDVPSSSTVQGVCVAQWPSAQQELKPDGRMILYCSKNLKKPYIVPDFRGKKLDLTKQVCEKHGIVCQVLHTGFATVEDRYADYVVRDQRPLPGTLLLLDHATKILFQFQV